MRSRWTLAIVGVILGLVVAVGWPVYVSPQVDPLRKADAIFVLGGPSVAPYSEGIELALAGYAPRVVMSNPIGDLNAWVADLCAHQRYGFTVTCFKPDPATTRGEAEELGNEAAAGGWRSVIVVAQTPHLSRARLIIERCFDGDLMMTDSQEHIAFSDWVLNYAYQTAGFVRAGIHSGC
jgi:hypothetical protein